MASGAQATDYAAGCPIVAAALGTERGAREVAGVDVLRMVRPDRRVARRRRRRAGAVGVVGGARGERARGCAGDGAAQGTSAPLDAVVDELEVFLGG